MLDQDDETIVFSRGWFNIEKGRRGLRILVWRETCSGGWGGAKRLCKARCLETGRFPDVVLVGEPDYLVHVVRFPNLQKQVGWGT